MWETANCFAVGAWSSTLKPSFIWQLYIQKLAVSFNKKIFDLSRRCTHSVVCRLIPRNYLKKMTYLSPVCCPFCCHLLSVVISIASGLYWIKQREQVIKRNGGVSAACRRWRRIFCFRYIRRTLMESAFSYDLGFCLIFLWSKVAWKL